MAVVDNEVIATKLIFRIYFEVAELEAMLKNTKVGGYTAVAIETNSGATNVKVEMR